MKRLRITLSSYGAFIRWLLYDSLWQRKQQVFAVLATGIMGVGFQVAVFGLLIVYVRHFASGESIVLAVYSVDPRNSVPLLAGVSLVVVVLFLFSTLCIYYSRQTILRMGREYEEFCGKRVFRLLRTGGDLFAQLGIGGDGDSYLFRLVKSDSRLAGRVLRLLLSLVIPGVTLVAAVAVLFYMEATLSLLIVGLGAVLLFYQYRVSRRAAQQSMRFEQFARAASAQYRNLVQHCKHLQAGGGNTDPAEQLFAKGPVRKQLDAYEGRLRAVESSRLVSGIFMAVVVGMILLVMGGSIIREGAGWGRLLVYVVALRFAMGNQQTVFQTITSINRFYPQVRRYFAFVRSLEGQYRGQYPPRDVYTLDVEGGGQPEALEGSAGWMELTAGKCLAVVTPLELNRYSLAALCQSLLHADESAVYSALFSARYASTGHSCPNTSLRRALALSDAATWADLREFFPDDGWWSLAREQLPQNLDKPIKANQWAKVKPELKFVLALISARLSGCSWIFMQADGLGLLSPDAARFYLAMFDDTIRVVVHNGDIGQVGSFDEGVVAVADEYRLLGLGDPDWFQRNQGRVLELMSRKATDGTKAPGAALEDDDLDE